MAAVVFVLLLLPAASGLCYVTGGNFSFNFTSLGNQALAINDSLYRVNLTFCRPASELCGGDSSSICQTEYARGFQFSLGLWSQVAWSASSSEGLVGAVRGSICLPTGSPRVTTIRISCQAGPATFKSFKETNMCMYELELTVPLRVCPLSCCGPRIFSLKRVVNKTNTLSVAVVQQDANVGNYLDETQTLKALCLRANNRCFHFNSTFCVGFPYAFPSSECVSVSVGWLAEGDYPVVNGSVMQRLWTGMGGYLLTVQLGGGCVVVAGSTRNPSLDLSAAVNPALWAIPEVCVRETQATLSI